MILFWLILIPLAAGILSWITARSSTTAPRWICLSAMIIDLILGVFLWFSHPFAIADPAQARWSEELDLELDSPTRHTLSSCARRT